MLKTGMVALSSMSLTEVAKRTIDTVRAVASELPHAEDGAAIAEVFLGGERQIYIGIALAAAALLALLFIG